MRYGVVFLLMAAYLAVLAIAVGGWAWALLWPALAFALAAVAYFGVGPRVFGKRPTGVIAPVHRAMMLPFLLFVWGVWHLVRRADTKPAYHEIVPGLFMGRRLASHELPPDLALVVDLTAEFDEPADIRNSPRYRSLPILDAGVPDARQFSAVVAEVAAARGPVFIHCAQGHGRSGLLIAAVLLARGLATTPAEAITIIQRTRPRVRLRPAQARFLESTRHS